jgi:hypothetical protein
MIKFDHTTFTQDPAMGWYEIGGKIYWDKASALLEGSRLGFKYSDLHWNFNDEVFGKFNWGVEPPGDIRLYYQNRAKELREKYDYIILNFSGGSDSTTILYSFVQANLFIDEIIYRHPTSGTKKYQSSKHFGASNEFSEYEFAAKPILDWFTKISPTTKITIHDFSTDIIDNKNLLWDENYIHWIGDYISPGCVVRYNHASIYDHLKEFDKGKKVGIIFGLDKPKVIVEGGKVYTYFMDRPLHNAGPAMVHNGFTNTRAEMFFWSPDARAMIAKQAHLIKKWFESPTNQMLRYMLDYEWLQSPYNRTAYESIAKAIIYPDYDLNIFQCYKPVRAVFHEWDYWLDDFKNTEGYKTFMRGMIHLYRNIDRSFLRSSGMSLVNNKKVGTAHDVSLSDWEYKPCMSNRYLIGNFAD